MKKIRHIIFFSLLSIWVPIPMICFGSSDTLELLSKDLPPPSKSVYQDGKFQNPHVVDSKKGLFRFLKMKYFGGNDWADYKETRDSTPVVKTDLEKINNPKTDLQATWIGHSTFLVQVKGVNFLTDPLFSDRASPFTFAGPKRVHPPALSLEELPSIHFVIISHNHYDHLDKKTVLALGNKVKWYVPLKNKEWFLGIGIEDSNVVEFDWWDSLAVQVKTGSNLRKIKVFGLPSQHWSARGITDRFECLWASFALQIDSTYIWFAGDTGYNPIQFKQIGKVFPGFDLAFIPIGAYAPRSFMKEHHANPEEAVQIHLEVRSRMSLGMHWGTVPLTAEPIDEPPKRLKKAAVHAGLSPGEFVTLAIGETVEMKSEWMGPVP